MTPQELDVRAAKAERMMNAALDGVSPSGMKPKDRRMMEMCVAFAPHDGERYHPFREYGHFNIPKGMEITPKFIHMLRTMAGRGVLTFLHCEDRAEAQRVNNTLVLMGEPVKGTA